MGRVFVFRKPFHVSTLTLSLTVLLYAIHPTSHHLSALCFYNCTKIPRKYGADDLLLPSHTRRLRGSSEYRRDRSVFVFVWGEASLLFLVSFVFSLVANQIRRNEAPAQVLHRRAQGDGDGRGLDARERAVFHVGRQHYSPLGRLRRFRWKGV